jgi:hypothetical protein
MPTGISRTGGRSVFRTSNALVPWTTRRFKFHLSCRFEPWVGSLLPRTVPRTGSVPRRSECAGRSCAQLARVLPCYLRPIAIPAVGIFRNQLTPPPYEKQLFASALRVVFGVHVQRRCSRNVWDSILAPENSQYPDSQFERRDRSAHRYKHLLCCPAGVLRGIRTAFAFGYTQPSGRHPKAVSALNRSLANLTLSFLGTRGWNRSSKSWQDWWTRN